MTRDPNSKGKPTTSRANSEPKSGADRLPALRGLRQVLDGRRTLDQIQQAEELSPFSRELLFGACRHFYSLRDTVACHMPKPLRRKDSDLWALLILATYQLQHLRVPDHAAVDTSVKLVGQLRKPWAKGLINATLRAIARAEKTVTLSEEAKFEHPQWLQQMLQTEYSNNAGALMLANNQRAPMALRVNVGQTTVAATQATLTKQNVIFESGQLPETLVLAEPMASAQLPGFADGLLAIQDAGAQLAAQCWESAPPPAAQNELNWLDACAAPGGKLHHIMERYQPKRVTALEISENRLSALKQDGQRLGHRNIDYHQADAETNEWWNGEPFDRILLDAPCSGSGTLRRNPDIKLLANPEQLGAHHQKQLNLLRNLWPMLRPGGSLLYSTCSLLKLENDTVIEAFSANVTDVEIQAITLPSGQRTSFGWQLTPLDPNTDGFFYALLTKSVQHA